MPLLFNFSVKLDGFKGIFISIRKYFWKKYYDGQNRKKIERKKKRVTTGAAVAAPMEDLFSLDFKFCKQARKKRIPQAQIETEFKSDEENGVILRIERD